MENYGKLIGDSRIDNLLIDFNNGTIIISITRYFDDVKEERMITFHGVINQDFRMINKDNILFDIEETDWWGLEKTFPEMMSRYKWYKKIYNEDKMRIDQGLLRCYHIQWSYGLDGYVIAESIEIKESIIS